MRSRGTFLPRRTFSRNGMTSSGFSGPPKESTKTASYFSEAIRTYCKCPLLAITAQNRVNAANRAVTKGSGPLLHYRNPNGRTTDTLRNRRAPTHRNICGRSSQILRKYQIHLLHARQFRRGSAVIWLIDHTITDLGENHAVAGQSSRENLDDRSQRSGMLAAIDAVILIQNAVVEDARRKRRQGDRLGRARHPMC